MEQDKRELNLDELEKINGGASGEISYPFTEEDKKPQIPLKCPVCGETFYRGAALIAHAKTHRDNPTYKNIQEEVLFAPARED